MANILPTDKKIQVIAALAEGSAIRSIERMTGIHRDTIMRLGVKVGQGCTRLMNENMRELDADGWRWTKFGGLSARRIATSSRAIPTCAVCGRSARLIRRPNSSPRSRWKIAMRRPQTPLWTVLHIPPAVSPETAVRAAIVQEFRSLDPA